MSEISEKVELNPEVAAKVSQHTKAVRYQARKNQVPLPKAFNDYVSSQNLSGTERTAVRQKLGMAERYSSWRDELELVEVIDNSPKTDKEAAKKIDPKGVKNTVVINPPMKEAFEEIGGIILEVMDIDEQEDKKKDSKPSAEQQRQLSMKAQMAKKQQMLNMQRIQMQKQGKLPMGHSEGYAPGDVDQKVGAVTSIPKKDQDAAKERLLAKAKAKRKEKGIEEKVVYGGAEAEKKAAYEKQLKKMLPKRAFDSTGRELDPRSGKRMEEETEDSLKDKRMERGGVDGNVRYDQKPRVKTGPVDKQKEMEKKKRALDFVKNSIRSQYGKGALMGK